MSRVSAAVIAVLCFLTAGVWSQTYWRDGFQAATTATSSSAVATVITAATTTHRLRESTTAAPVSARWKQGIATTFWVGEGETNENGYISNVPSAWDGNWMQHYGGVDSPDHRCGFEPCGFTPQENPFYVALPYNDLDDIGERKPNSTRLPWYTVDASRTKSILKNRWIEVRFQGTSCFGQWEDVGPFHEDDIEYVFGDARLPLNTEGEHAGIDLSPALSQCLNTDGSDMVEWRHVEAGAVPAGPWRATVTSRI